MINKLKLIEIQVCDLQAKRSNSLNDTRLKDEGIGLRLKASIVNLIVEKSQSETSESPRFQYRQPDRRLKSKGLRIQKRL